MYQGEKALIYPPHTNALDMVTPCPVCGTEERKAWIAQHCGMEHQERNRQLIAWRTPAMPQREWREQRAEAKTAMMTAITARAGLWTFWGDFGSGKTLAVQIILNELRRDAIEGFYAPFAVILDHLRSLVRDNAESSTFWQRLLDVPVLAVDEVTRFKATDFAREKLFVLADTRYRRRNSHLTLFATNDDPRQHLAPEDAIGYLFSRMREGHLVELRGDVREAVQ